MKGLLNYVIYEITGIGAMILVYIILFAQSTRDYFVNKKHHDTVRRSIFNGT